MDLKNSLYVHMATYLGLSDPTGSDQLQPSHLYNICLTKNKPGLGVEIPVQFSYNDRLLELHLRTLKC